jgi:hypothetical protein
MTLMQGHYWNQPGGDQVNECGSETKGKSEYVQVKAVEGFPDEDLDGQNIERSVVSVLKTVPVLLPICLTVALSFVVEALGAAAMKLSDALWQRGASASDFRALVELAELAAVYFSDSDWQDAWWTVFVEHRHRPLQIFRRGDH